MNEIQDALFASLDADPGEASAAPEPVSQEAGGGEAAAPASAGAPAEAAPQTDPTAAVPAPEAPPVAATAPPAVLPEDAAATRTVPLAELIAERRRYQAAIAEAEERGGRELKELREQLAKLQATAQPAAEPEPEPDFLEDPKNYVDRTVGRQQKATETAVQKIEQMAQQLEAQQMQARFMQAVQNDEAAFLGKQGDYHDALNFVRNQRSAELQLLYPEATQEQVMQQVAQEEIALAANAMQSKRSPAEIAYQYAQKRGYQVKAAPAAAVTPAAKPAIPANPAAAAAAMTLGSGGAASETTPEDSNDPMPEFGQALREAFGRR